MKITDVIPIVAAAFIVAAIAIGAVGGWFVYQCGNESTYSAVWVPQMTCLGILLGTIIGVVVFGGIGVALSQVQ